MKNRLYIFEDSETDKAYKELTNAIWEKEYGIVDWHWTRLYEMVDNLVIAVRNDCMKAGGGTIEEQRRETEETRK